MTDVLGAGTLDYCREVKDMSMSDLLILCRGLPHPRMHLSLVFKHAGTWNVEDHQGLRSPLYLARFHSPVTLPRQLLQWIIEPTITFLLGPLAVLKINMSSCNLESSLSDSR